MIDYDDLGGMVVMTHTGHKTVTQLLVKKAEPSDSGEYTCQPSNGEPAFVMLHVLYGEWRERKREREREIKREKEKERVERMKKREKKTCLLLSLVSVIFFFFFSFLSFFYIYN